MNEIKYKKPLSIEEQVDYLEKNKHVVYNECSKDKAMQYLYCHNYINVISPFKENFARHDENNNIVRDENGNHIYDFPVDFSQYQNLYTLERIKYPTIYTNIMNFETAFNAIVSNEVIKSYNIDSYSSFLSFISNLKENLLNLKNYQLYKDLAINHMSSEINQFIDLMDKYNSIYIFMDRLSLSQIITVYRCVNIDIHNSIFSSLLSNDLTFNYSSPGTFDDFLKRIVPIRNCIAHYNSINILIDYYDIKNKAHRSIADKKRYKKIIAKLCD